MESRMYPREQVDLDVNLIWQGNVLASAKAVDLSKGGVAIENPDVPLNRGQILDVELAKTGHPQSKRLNVRAMVIHTSIDRIGLMFAKKIKL